MKSAWIVVVIGNPCGEYKNGWVQQYEESSFIGADFAAANQNPHVTVVDDGQEYLVHVMDVLKYNSANFLKADKLADKYTAIIDNKKIPKHVDCVGCWLSINGYDVKNDNFDNEMSDGETNDHSGSEHGFCDDGPQQKCELLAEQKSWHSVWNGSIMAETYFSQSKPSVTNERFVRPEAEALADEHAKIFVQLDSSSFQHQFDQWALFLNEGFHLIFYGYGSKLQVLHDFYTEKLNSDVSCLRLKGFDSSVTYRKFVNLLFESLQLKTVSSSNPAQQLDAIVQHFKHIRTTSRDCHLVLLIDNIDGIAMRPVMMRRAVTAIAACESVSICASADHLRTPLLWGELLSSGRCLWINCTTLARHIAEMPPGGYAAFAVGQEHSIHSLSSVYASLTQNAQKLLKLIANESLAGRNCSWDQFYALARQEFLVSSETALRQLMIEFTDHNVVQIKRLADGNEIVKMSVDVDLLKKFLDSLEDDAQF